MYFTVSPLALVFYFLFAGKDEKLVLCLKDVILVLILVFTLLYRKCYSKIGLASDNTKDKDKSYIG